jgi:hypothetical protein
MKSGRFSPRGTRPLTEKGTFKGGCDQLCHTLSKLDLICILPPTDPTVSSQAWCTTTAQHRRTNTLGPLRRVDYNRIWLQFVLTPRCDVVYFFLHDLFACGLTLQRNACRLATRGHDKRPNLPSDVLPTHKRRERKTFTSRRPIPQFSPHNTHNTHIRCSSPPRRACTLTLLKYSQLCLLPAQPPRTCLSNALTPQLTQRTTTPPIPGEHDHQPSSLRRFTSPGWLHLPVFQFGGWAAGEHGALSSGSRRRHRGVAASQNDEQPGLGGLQLGRLYLLVVV